MSSMKVECTGCGQDCSNAYGTHLGNPYHFGCLPAKQSKAKMRHCWNCGAEMGVIEDRHYDSRDTCGKAECDREARDMEASERSEAHEQLDRDRGWS